MVESQLFLSGGGGEGCAGGEFKVTHMSFSARCKLPSVLNRCGRRGLGGDSSCLMVGEVSSFEAQPEPDACSPFSSPCSFLLIIPVLFLS